LLRCAGWRLRTPLVGLLIMCGKVVAADADELPAVSDLDGIYITAGPVVAGVHVADEWLSAAGLEVSVVRLRERRIPTLLGVDAGGVSYVGRAGGRLWLELETAVREPLPLAVGLSVGPTLEVDPVRPPRLGVEATLWTFVGFIPYVRVGALRETGSFLETGIMIKVPARRF
jgi:hypothetical protein